MSPTVKEEFPALRKRKDTVLDGAGGSQVHDSVIRAVTEALTDAAANVGGLYESSKRVSTIVERGRSAFADFFNADPDEIVFGANATTLNVHLGNALFRSFDGKTNVVLSSLEHDSNAGLWARFAEARGLDVRVAPLKAPYFAVDTDAMVNLIDENTAFVAVGLASNGIGTINDDVKTVCAAASSVGALSFVDAVHAAPHVRLDVRDLQCDFAVVSPYKFFGPHLGVLCGRRDLLASLKPDKLRVSDDGLPSRENPMSKWETGTQQFEAIAGATAAVEYLASLGERFGGVAPPPEDLLSLHTTQTSLTRRHLLDAAYDAIAYHEDALKTAFLRGASAIPGLTVFGHADPDADLAARTSTFAVALDGLSPDDLVADLVSLNIACTAGTHYCSFWQPYFQVPGAARLSFLHYNDVHDVRAALDALDVVSTRRRSGVRP